MTSAWGFLAGLPLGAAGIALPTDWRPAEFAPWPKIIVAALIVGSGTRIGSGWPAHRPQLKTRSVS